MSDASSFKPQESTAAVKTGLVPYLVVDGAIKAAEFYGRAFGAETVAIMPPDEKGRTAHAHIHVNGNSVMLCDPYPERGMEAKPHQGYHLMLQVEDIASWWKRAIEAGATSINEPADMFWGARHGMLRDPFGVTWAINQPLA
jgi:uncharacterized glyoxalase superfamily protein PhnB